MEGAVESTADAPLDRGLLAAAARGAVASARSEKESAKAISAAIATLYEGIAGIYPSVFVVEHGRLWLVAQRGYAVVPDGIPVGRGIMGRAIRKRLGQLIADVGVDPDYVEGLPGVQSELSVPLVAGDVVVGVLNIESERALPADGLELVLPLVQVLTPQAEALRAATTLDLAALARLFVYLGSLRDPDEIAALGAASLARVLPVEATQVWTWDATDTPLERSSWHSDGSATCPLTVEELEQLRAVVDPTVVCQLVDQDGGTNDSVVWLPLRTNAQEIGALVGVTRADAGVDAAQLDAAAVLAAHVAASLDAARPREAVGPHRALRDAPAAVHRRRHLHRPVPHDTGGAAGRGRLVGRSAARPAARLQTAGAWVSPGSPDEVGAAAGVSRQGRTPDSRDGVLLAFDHERFPGGDCPPGRAHEPVLDPWDEEQLDLGLDGSWLVCRGLDCCPTRLERGLARLDGALPALESRALELDGSQLFASPSDVLLGGGKRLFPSAELSLEVHELLLAGFQLGSAPANQPLHRCALVAQAFFAARELERRLLEPRRVLLELRPPLLEHAFQLALRVRPAMAERSSHDARRSCIRKRVGLGVVVLSGARDHEYGSTAGSATGGPVLSRRVRTIRRPRRLRRTLGHSSCPNGLRNLNDWGMEGLAFRADTAAMDPQGARHLLARIRAGVGVGSRIELVGDAGGDSGLCAGDRGVVNQIDETGHLIVLWDRGFAFEIDPEDTPFRPLAA